MADKGIIFSAPMVRALLDGRKTQTRRLAKPRKTPSLLSGEWTDEYVLDPGNADWLLRDLPYAPGDRLYVREAWQVRGTYTDVIEVGYRASQHRSHTEYVEQFPIGTVTRRKGRFPTFPKYGPSIHMPRWASRLWLAVTDVRVQRLQDISEKDAVAEGVVWQEPSEEDLQWAAEQAVEYGTSADLDGVWLVPGTDGGDGRQIWGCTPQQAYQFLWNSLHTEPGTRWQDNPWIVAVSFDVNRGNIDGGANG